MTSVFYIRLQKRQSATQSRASTTLLSTVNKHCNEFALNLDFINLGRQCKSLHLTEALSNIVIISFLNQVQQFLWITDATLEGWLCFDPPYCSHVFNSQTDIILLVSETLETKQRDEPLKGSKEKGDVCMIVLCCFRPLSKAHWMQWTDS